MASDAGRNLRRLMADLDLSVKQTSQRSGLDKRTITAILEGKTKPRPHTINRLAKGLGVSTDEFFLKPPQLLYRHFDRHTNPVVEEVVQAHPELFQDWTAADFEELHSRRATGGAMTTEGALAAVHEMNRKRQLVWKLSVLLETGHADLIAGIVDVLYDRIVVSGD